MKCPHCHRHLHFRVGENLYRAVLHGAKREKVVRVWSRPGSPYGGWHPVPEPQAIELWGKYVEAKLFSCQSEGKVAG